MKTLPLAAVLRIRYRIVKWRQKDSQEAPEVWGGDGGQRAGVGVREDGAGTREAAMKMVRNIWIPDDIMVVKWTGFEG